MLLCCCTANLLHWSATRYAMLCSNALIIKLMRCAFSFSTHTDARVMSQWGHKHTNNISRTNALMSVSPFHWSKTILISYTHRNVKVFTTTHQNKIRFLKSNQITFTVTSPQHMCLGEWSWLWSGLWNPAPDIAAEIFVQQNIHTTTKIMKTLFFKEWSQHFECFNFNSKFCLFAKKVKFSRI